MPPKKKPQKTDEDDPTLSIIKFYKKKCDLNGISPQAQCKFFKDKVDEKTNDGEPLDKARHTFSVFPDFLKLASFMG